MLIRNRHLLSAAMVASIAAWSGMTIGAFDHQRGPRSTDDRMSASGHAAARARAVIENGLPGVGAAKDFEEAGVCMNEPDCGDEGPPADGPSATQAETSIAVDSTGQHLVIGFNDFR